MSAARSAAEEARDPGTSPERLLDLTNRHPQLQGLIVANPSCPPVARDWILATNPWAKKLYEQGADATEVADAVDAGNAERERTGQLPATDPDTAAAADETAPFTPILDETAPFAPVVEGTAPSPQSQPQGEQQEPAQDREQDQVQQHRPPEDEEDPSQDVEASVWGPYPAVSGSAAPSSAVSGPESSDAGAPSPAAPVSEESASDESVSDPSAPEASAPEAPAPEAPAPGPRAAASPSSGVRLASDDVVPLGPSPSADASAPSGPSASSAASGPASLQQGWTLVPAPGPAPAESEWAPAPGQYDYGSANSAPPTPGAYPLAAAPQPGPPGSAGQPMQPGPSAQTGQPPQGGQPTQAMPVAPAVGRGDLMAGAPGDDDGAGKDHRRTWIACGGCLLLALIVLIAGIFGVRAWISGDEDDSYSRTTESTTSQEAEESPSEEPTSEEPTEEDPVSPAPDGSLDLDAVQSPTGNIRCSLADGSVGCSISERDFSAGDQEDCSDGPFSIAVSSGEAAPACGTAYGSDSAETLEYGSSTTIGDVACTSRSDGMTCWNIMTGKGFSVNRDEYTTF